MMQATDEAMTAVPACSNADRYFAETMVPHHRGAIAMAQWELKHGSNPTLLNASQNIITSQGKEVEDMQHYLTMLPSCDTAAGPPSGAASSNTQLNMGGMGGMQMGGMGGMQMGDMSGMQMESASGMQMNMPVTPMAIGSPAAGLAPSEAAYESSMSMTQPIPLSGNPDRDYALEMAAHHQAAINMAEVELQYGAFQPLKDLARHIVVSQTQQIAIFKTILSQHYSTSI